MRVWRAQDGYHLLYYQAGRVAYATSDDAHHWTRPSLGLIEHNGCRDNNLVTEVGGDLLKAVFEDPTAPPHNSMNLAWRILEYLPQLGAPKGAGLFGWRLPCEARRSIPEGARIHRAVFTRSDALGGDLPPNLPQGYEIEEG